jgi:peptide/nickel transport system permease protein
MMKFVGRRLGLGLITLWLLSVLVSFGSQVLPGDVARRVLGPFASQSAVNALNKQLGTNKPVIEQYFQWIGHLFQGNLGTSIATRSSVSSIIWPAFGHSIKLAILAFILVVPLASSAACSPRSTRESSWIA